MSLSPPETDSIENQKEHLFIITWKLKIGSMGRGELSYKMLTVETSAGHTHTNIYHLYVNVK
jgi:hypothetical protein